MDRPEAADADLPEPESFDEWDDLEPEEIGFQLWEPDALEDDEPEPEAGDFWLETNDEEEI